MTIYGSVMDEINSRGIDCVPMSPHVQEVRMDAIRQTEEAFKGGRKQLYAAMEVVGEVLLYARNQGVIALSKDGTFRDGPYVLDLIEKKMENKVPVRPYLEFGLEHISNGEKTENVTGFLANRYFVCHYTAADALTAYIYCISVAGLIYGISYASILEYVSSLVPDSELSCFDEFAADKKESIEMKRYHYMGQKLGKEFSEWDADAKKIAELDRYGLRTVFRDLLRALDDNGICRLLMKMDNLDICYSLLECDEQMRWYVMRLLGENHRFKVMEELMDIPFAVAETLEKCMETMGRIIKTGIFHIRTGTVLKGLEERGNAV
ncbi:MAG: hypothetical protein OSJ73_17465 [Lachnospiraceae bacterium]|nr:hypothetical protein [Lachnospiraceae bacterium]